MIVVRQPRVLSELSSFHALTWEDEDSQTQGRLRPGGDDEDNDDDDDDYDNALLHSDDGSQNDVFAYDIFPALTKYNYNNNDDDVFCDSCNDSGR